MSESTTQISHNDVETSRSPNSENGRNGDNTSAGFKSEDIEWKEGVLLEWRNLSFYTSPEKSIWQRFAHLFQRTEEPKKSGSRPLLKNVNGRVLPGEMVALMGASGAGKSTLLNILAARFTGQGKLTGSITINGKNLTKSWHTLVGYVEQVDNMYDNLTVEETISLSAMMRLPSSSYSKEKKLQRVENVIHTLGLDLIRKKRVGGGGSTGISGGERKRVSIGIELAADPVVLFLDEPTSGLDSFSAFYTIEALGKLAKTTKKCILITIHQPRFDLLELFDRIFLMAQGQLVFKGKIDEACHYFEQLGFHSPPHSSPSDYFLNIMTIDSRSPELVKESLDRVKIFQQAWEMIETEDLLSNDSEKERAKSIHFVVPAFETLLKETQPEHIHTENEASGMNQTALLIDRKFIPGETIKLTIPTSRTKTLTFAYPSFDESSIIKWAVPLTTEIYFLALRNWRGLHRNVFARLSQLFQIIVFIVIGGFAYFRLGLSQESVVNRIGIIFLVIISAKYTVIAPLLNFPIERSIIIRERSSGMYRPFSAFISKTLVYLPFYVVLNGIYISAIYWIVGLQENAANFFIFLVNYWMLVFFAISFGLAVGASCSDINTSQIVGSTLLIILIVFGGDYVTPILIPPWLVWIFWLSPVQYIFKALMQNEFANLNFICTEDSPYCIPNGEAWLNLYELNNPLLWTNFLIVLGFSVFTQALGYVFLKFNTAPLRLKTK